MGDILNRTARSLLKRPRRNFINVSRNSSILGNLRWGPNLLGLRLTCLIFPVTHCIPLHLRWTNGLKYPCSSMNSALVAIPEKKLMPLSHLIICLYIGCAGWKKFGHGEITLFFPQLTYRLVWISNVLFVLATQIAETSVKAVHNLC